MPRDLAEGFVECGGDVHGVLPQEPQNLENALLPRIANPIAGLAGTVWAGSLTGGCCRGLGRSVSADVDTNPLPVGCCPPRPTGIGILALSRKPRSRGMKRQTSQEICGTLNVEGRKTRYGGESRPANLSALLVKPEPVPRSRLQRGPVTSP